MLSSANVSLYLGWVVKDLERQHLVTRGKYKRRCTVRHGQDVKRPAIRTTVLEYLGGNTDICTNR